MPYVITDGDEGVQINTGTRLAVLGAGVNLPEFPKIVVALKKLFGDDLRVAANEQNEWIKREFELSNWEQVSATAQQRTEQVADQEKLLYSGILPFADPKELKHGIKGHMVRPRDIHIANSICFTVGGGEQTYHLGQYLISADWVSEVSEKVAKSAIEAQVAFYQSLAGDTKLSLSIQTEGELGEKVAAKNQKVLEKIGYSF